jgi:tetratricopeptide (TPR) repeat protein
MMSRNVKIVLSPLLAVVLFNLLVLSSPGQMAIDDPAPPASPISSLGLAPAQVLQLRQAIDARDYITAEKLLLAEIDRAPHSANAARQLAFAGSVYFLNHDYINAAIAWKKSQAIAPLDPRLEFSLAMAYIRIARPDWARTELESLAAANNHEALYPYWLGRLDYDGHEYLKAINHFKHAIELAPEMARAYDNLGLCYYYQNQNDLAVENYKRAIELDRASPHPSAWPFLNLAITQQFLNQLPDAEANLRQAIRLDSGFAQAHFQLGTVLEDLDRPQDAIAELREAARIDPGYPEPHMAMARIYHKLGQEPQAREEVQIYRRLHAHAAP